MTIKRKETEAARRLDESIKFFEKTLSKIDSSKLKSLIEQLKDF